MTINREEIRDLVGIFYQPVFKTFYINSLDEQSFTKPVGVFVSLGIATSMKVLEDIKNVLEEKYHAVIAEISSKKVGGQFLNTLISTSPQQYLLTEFDDSILDEAAAKAELTRLHEMMNPNGDLKVLLENAPKVSRLQELINKLDSDNSWNNHQIQYENGEYKIFHKLVNYKKTGDVEYRVGIYVCEKD